MKRLPSICAAACALALGLVAAPAAAEPEAPSPKEPSPKDHDQRIEVSLLVATSITFADVAYPTQALIDRKVGMGGSLAVAYKTSYFLFPFLDVSYFDLARATVPALGLADAPLVHNALSGWFSYAGAGVDLGPLRLKLGLGFDVLQRSSQAGGLDNQVSSVDLGALVTAAVRLVKRDRFALAFEGRYIQSPASGNSFLALGLSLRADPLVF